MKDKLRPFHLAIPITDIHQAHNWYTNILDCTVGRQSEEWVDFNFFGHQLVAHLVSVKEDGTSTNPVDGEDVPSRHFGIIMQMEDWKGLVQHLKEKKIKFLIQPQIRFKGKAGEQSTFFILDPFGNALEFKAFQDDSQIYSVEL